MNIIKCLTILLINIFINYTFNGIPWPIHSNKVADLDRCMAYQLSIQVFSKVTYLTFVFKGYTEL